MEPKPQIDSGKIIAKYGWPLFAFSAVLSIFIAKGWFPQISGSHGSFLEKVFLALFAWAVPTIVIFATLVNLFEFLKNRPQILSFLLKPYVRQVIVVFIAISIFPWIIETFTSWSQLKFEYLEIYGMTCLIPIILIALFSAAFLSPRLNLRVTILLLIGGIFFCSGMLLLLQGFIYIFFESYVYKYSRNDLLFSLELFPLAFFIVWIVWSLGLFIKNKLPVRFQQFIKSINSYVPNKYFILLCLVVIWIYPLMVYSVQIRYLSVLSTWGEVLGFSSLDKSAWRVFLGIRPLLLGVFFLLFLGYATVRLFRDPKLAKKILPNSPLSGFFVLSWFFGLWWVFFSSTAICWNFLVPGAFVFTNDTLNIPSFVDFIVYTFGIMTPLGDDNIRAIGVGANLLRIWMWFTGWVNIFLIAEVIAASFVRKYDNA